jgi:hypothetical protein
MYMPCFATAEVRFILPHTPPSSLKRSSHNHVDPTTTTTTFTFTAIAVTAAASATCHRLWCVRFLVGSRVLRDCPRFVGRVQVQRLEVAPRTEAANGAAGHCKRRLGVHRVRPFGGQPRAHAHAATRGD